MYVLGIETSCDETAASIVKDGRKILSSAVTSSLKFHQKYGGVIPEIAFRMQLETISQVVDSAVKESGVRRQDIKLVSVTDRPGLAGSLFVGISFAKAVSLCLGIPLIEVNHLHAHIYANFLGDNNVARFPFIALVVSGGHTSLFYIRDFDKIEALGSTLDDACGEAFDKVAKILGLGYPGGPYIEKLARNSGKGRINFRCSGTDSPLDFSFSGIKTAVMYYARKNNPLTRKSVSNIAASFQDSAINVLIEKSLLACKLKRVKEVVVGGGVAANTKLKEEFFRQAKARGIKVYFPSKELCMDNAAMVAGLAYQLFKKGGCTQC